MDATGWTFEQIDAMAVADVAALLRHWNERPPFVECVRAYLGVNPDAAQDVKDELDAGPQREITEEEWQRMCEREKAYAAEQNGRRNPFTG